MSRDPALARQIWQRLELIHVVTYFSPEPIGALRDAGYKGFWMGYFAGRAAPLGAVGPEVVTALFYNFAPSRVARALPDAWGFAPPEAALSARRRGLGRGAAASARRCRRRRRRVAGSARRRVGAAGRPGVVRRQHHVAVARRPAGHALARRHVAARAPRRRTCRSADREPESPAARRTCSTPRRAARPASSCRSVATTTRRSGPPTSPPSRHAGC